MQKVRFASTKNPELSKAPFILSGVGKNIAWYASPAVGYSVLSVSTVPVHSALFSFLLLLLLLLFPKCSSSAPMRQCGHKTLYRQ